MPVMTFFHFLHPFWKRWGPALVVMAVIFVFSSIPSQEIPDFGSLDFTVKKLGHVAGYALLGAAYLHALGDQKSSAAWLALSLAILFAITDEFHQYFVPGRNASPIDVLIDGAGAWIGIQVWMLRSKMLMKKQD
jgi:VanZ family protein